MVEVFIDTFSGWVEAFPTKKETANVVAKKILEDILPQFGIPKVTGSDNGPAFIAQVQNTPRPLGLTPFEILFGVPPPLFETLESVALPDGNNFIPSTHILAHLKALETIRREIWEQLKDTYTVGDPAVHHQFEVGNAVLVQRHQTGNLELWWKGPYLVLLTIPTTIKVEGIPTLVYASHVKRAPPKTSSDGWALKKTDNPLKLCLRHRHNSESRQ
ncbi:uncharacterized protein LOC143443994 [Arvicanthis niloticus]|uniref:uncharacterized protein LOC143314263 n=1 Tax=Arvicanthis niloticus TaxID=61156 RepID=UPI00402BE60E